MLSAKDKKLIIDISKKYNVSEVILFGSSLIPDKESNDIDIGIKGIKAEDYYAFYGELLRTLSKPVDVIDLSTRNSFTDLVREEGIALYA